MIAASVAQPRKDGISIRVRAKPRASKSAIRGVMAEDADQPALVVAIAAPPADGEANAELIHTIARALDVRRGAVSIASGETGRTKLVLVSGYTAALMQRLAAAISASQDKR